MNLRPLLALTVAASAFAAAAPPNTPAPRPRLTDDLRLRAVEESAVSNPKEPAALSRDGSVALPPVRVTGTYLPPLRKFEDEVPQNQPFTLRDGGTLLRHDGRTFVTELKFQYHPAHRGFDLLNFCW